jgi:hypothetical protein
MRAHPETGARNEDCNQMASKSLDLAVRAPHKDLNDPELLARAAEEAERLNVGIERELAELIAKHGPDPDRLIALLERRPIWERKRAELRLAGDYGAEVARVINRCVDNHGIFDDTHPVIVRLREAATSPGGHGRLLARAAQKRAAGQRMPLPESVRRNSRPLPDNVRADLERTVGESAADVRVMTGPEATEAARAVGAQAFTTDGTIVIPEGEFRPDTDEGRELLAHEAVHALQQRGGGTGAGLSSRAAEHEADRIAAHVVQTPLGPVGAPRAPMPIGQGMGAQSIARKEADQTSSKPGPGSKNSDISLPFRLGPATVTVKISVPGSPDKESSGGGGSPTIQSQVDLDTSKLNSLLPAGVTFTTPKVSIKVNGTKLVAPITIGAKYAGKSPYLKPVDFQFQVQTDGSLSAKIKLDCQIPGFASAKSDDIEIKKDGITGDIHITSEKFTFKGVGSLAVQGELVVHVKNNEIEKIDGEANITLPQGFGSAKIDVKTSGSKIDEITAELKGKTIPGLGTLDCKLQWSEGGGFQLLPPGQKLDVSKIPGLKGSVQVTFAAPGKGFTFSVDPANLQFTPKCLQQVKVGKIDISDKGLKASVSLTGVNFNVPGWLQVGQLKGTVEIDGTSLSCKGVGGNITVGGKSKGTFEASFQNGEFKAKGKITTLGFAEKVLKINGPSLDIDLDLGDGKTDASVTGGLQVTIGQWAKGTVDSLQFKDGHFTGKSNINITKGLLNGVTIKLELMNNDPYVKADIDAKSLLNRKITLPGASKIPVDVSCTKADLHLSSDVSDLAGNIEGDVKVDGGKLADGTFSFAAAGGHISGDITANVKKLPFVTGSGAVKIHMEDEKFTGGGSVTLQFEKYLKGPITVAYDTAKGFSVAGKGLTVEIPGNPLDIKPFDVSYEGGQFKVENLTGDIIPGKIPGVKSGTVAGSFTDGKLKLSVTNIKFTLPALDKSTVSATWDDGKWTITGEATIDFKGVTATAKFNAAGGGGDKLSFDCDIDLDAQNLNKLIPGTELSGKLSFHYGDGKLTMKGGEVAAAFAKHMIDAKLQFTYNEADSTFNATGTAKFSGLKFIKGNTTLTITIDHNKLKDITLTGLELDLPIGKGKLTGDASFKDGTFSAKLHAEVTDIPMVQQATADVTITDNKVTAFSASGTLKEIPGLPLKGVTLAGGLDGETPWFGADGNITIPGVSDPLQFHFKVEGSKVEASLKGTIKVPAIGSAAISADVSTNGDWKASLTFTPTNTKLVKQATGHVESTGGKITWGGSITLAIANIATGSVEFEKLGDGDFMLKGTIQPGKSNFGGGKKELLGTHFGPPDIMIPIFSIGVVGIHASVGIGASASAGIQMPQVTIDPIEISGKLSQLEGGQLPDVKIGADVSAGAYASMGFEAHAGGGIDLLVAAALDLMGQGSANLDASVTFGGHVELQKAGDSYKIVANPIAKAQGDLSLGIGLHLVGKLFGKAVPGCDFTLAEKTWPVASFKIGDAPMKTFEYDLGTGKGPSQGDVTPQWPSLPDLLKKGVDFVGNLISPIVAEAKDIIQKAKDIALAPVHAAEYVGGKIVDGAEAVGGAISDVASHIPW